MHRVLSIALTLKYVKSIEIEKLTIKFIGRSYIVQNSYSTRTKILLFQLMGHKI